MEYKQDKTKYADWVNIRWWEDEYGNPTDWEPEVYFAKMIIGKTAIPIKGLASKLWN